MADFEALSVRPFLDHRPVDPDATAAKTTSRASGPTS